MAEYAAAAFAPAVPVLPSAAPVIVLTGAADVKTAIESLKLGAYDFIMKPVNVDELLIAAERALERRQLLIERRQYQAMLEVRVEEATHHLAAAYRELESTYGATLEALGSVADSLAVGLERKRAEEELRIAKECAEASAHWARLTVDTAFDAFVAMDETGSIIDWNPEAEAACLRVPEHRVHALLLAAALAEEAARGEEGGVPHRRRAMALLRSVLEIDVVIEAILDRRPVGELGVGPEPKDGGREYVGAGVAQAFQVGHLLPVVERLAIGRRISFSHRSFWEIISANKNASDEGSEAWASAAIGPGR